MSCEVKPSVSPSTTYSHTDANLLMAHVQKHFGAISGIGQTQLSTGRAIDILVVAPPSRKHLGKIFSSHASPSAGEETLLITFGAGACSMNVPKDSELPPRAEYLIRLPADWNAQADDEQNAWPVHLLINIASQPETEQSYNAWGHTFSFLHGSPFADNTRLCAAMLTGMNDREGQCRLSDGEAVTFYEVIPLYAEEMTFAAEHDPVALIDEFIRYNIPRTVAVNRPNVAILAKEKNALLKKYQAMSEAELRHMMQKTETLSREEQAAIAEVLQEKAGLGQRALGMMKGMLSAVFKR